MLQNGKKGQGLIEYVLIIGLILLVAVGAMRALGTNLTSKLGAVNTSLSAEDGPIGNH